MKSNKLNNALYVFYSTIFFGSYGLWSKLMTPGFGEFTQSWTRALIIMLILGVIIIYKKSWIKIAKIDYKWFFIISLGGFVLPLYFFGFRFLDAGFASVLFFGTWSIFSGILGKLFFKEKITKSKLISIFIGLTGIILLVTLDPSNLNILAVLASILAAIFSATEVVFTQKISNKYGFAQITFIIFLATFTISIIPDIFLFKIPSLNDHTAWLAQTGHTTATLLGMYFVVNGFKGIEPSVGGVIGLMEAVFGVLLATIFLQENLTINIVVGVLLVIISGIIANAKDIASKDKY